MLAYFIYKLHDNPGQKWQAILQIIASDMPQRHSTKSVQQYYLCTACAHLNHISLTQHHLKNAILLQRTHTCLHSRSLQLLQWCSGLNQVPDFRTDSHQLMHPYPAAVAGIAAMFTPTALYNV